MHGDKLMMTSQENDTVNDVILWCIVQNVETGSVNGLQLVNPAGFEVLQCICIRPTFENGTFGIVTCRYTVMLVETENVR